MEKEWKQSAKCCTGYTAFWDVNPQSTYQSTVYSHVTSLV